MGIYYPYAYGDGNLDNMRIIIIDGKIASHAAIYSRFVNTSDGLILKIGCIGGVATLPEYRGKGYATIILRDCIKKMESEGYDISILWTDTPEFYRKLGWEWAGQGCNFHLNSGNIFILPEYNEKIKLGTSIEDYSEINEIYEKNALRSQRQLDEYPLLFNSQRKLYYQKNGKIMGYVLVSDENTVLEYGGNVFVVASIIRSLIEKGKLSVLRVFTPPQNDGLLEYFKELNIPKNSFYIGMIRIINESKFIQKFKVKKTLQYSLNQLSKLYFGPEKVSGKFSPLKFYLWQTEHM
jgi:predicted acetyltransferase